MAAEKLNRPLIELVSRSDLFSTRFIETGSLPFNLYTYSALSEASLSFFLMIAAPAS